LYLGDCDDEAALVRMRGWLEQYATDALREHESAYVLADLDPDLIDQYLDADRASADANIAAVLAFTRARLDTRRLARGVMQFIDDRGLWPIVVARIGASRDPLVIVECVCAVLNEHFVGHDDGA
jgi:hypothetical protein